MTNFFLCNFFLATFFFFTVTFPCTSFCYINFPLCFNQFMTCNSLDCRHLPHYSRSFIGLFNGHAPSLPTAQRLSHLTLLCIAKRFNLLAACQQDCHGGMSCFFPPFPRVTFSLLNGQIKFPALHTFKRRITCVHHLRFA